MTASPSTASDIDLRAGEAIYFFALAGAPSLPEVDGAVEGLTDAPVRCIACGDWTAVVDRVDRANWAGEDAEDNLQSIEWVGPRAVRHEEVIEAVMEQAPVFPARFGTLFSSVEQLVRRIASRQDALQAYFERVAGCREWTLRGHLEREVAQEALAEPDDGSETRPGTAYLKKQKRVQDARGDVEAWLDEVAARLDRRLAPSTKEIEPQEPAPVERGRGAGPRTRPARSGRSGRRPSHDAARGERPSGRPGTAACAQRSLAAVLLPAGRG